LVIASIFALNGGSVLCAQTEWQSGASGANADRWAGGSAPQNWVGLSPPDATGAWARFGNLDGGLNVRDISLNGDRTLGLLDVTRTSSNANFTLSDNALTFNNSSSNSLLELLGGNSLTIASSINVGGNDTLAINQASSGTLTLSGQINGGGKTFLRSGSGDLTFGGSFFGNNTTVFRQTGTGTTTVSGSAFQVNGEVENGIVALDNSNTQGFSQSLSIGGGGNTAEVRLLNDDRIFSAQSVTILELGTLNLNNFDQSLNGVILRAGTVDSGSGTLSLSGGTNQRITTQASTDTATITGNLSFTGFTNNITVADGAVATDLLISADLSGSTRIIRDGAGTLRLSGDNSSFGVDDSFNPGWQLNAGITEFSADNNLGTALNRVRIGSGASLRAINSTTLDTSRVIELSTGGGVIDVSAGNTLSSTAANQLVGSGSLTKTGAGTLRVTNATQTFSGGLIVNDGTYLADTTGNLTIGGSGNSILGGGSVTVDGADALLHVNTTGDINYNRNTSINNGGTVRLSPGGPYSDNIENLGGRFTFGSGGGLLDLDGFVNETVLNLTTNADAATPAVVRYGTITNSGDQGGWPSGSTLQLNGGLNAGSVDNVVRFELTDGAMVEQRFGQSNFNGTLVIAGQPGGDPSVGSYLTDVGRWSLIEDGTYTYDGGIFFEDTVQFTIFNGTRTVDSDLTVRDGGIVAFQGRSTGSDNQDPLVLGTNVNDRTLLVESGGEAILDIRYRADDSINTGGVTLNNRTVLEGDANLRFSWSNQAANGTASRHIVDGDVVGQGFGSTRATDSRILIDDAINSGLGVGGIDWSDSMDLIVNSNSKANGLRLEGNISNLQNLLRADGGTDNARLDGVTGSGGTLTIALNNASAQDLLIDRAPTTGSNVALGFDVAPGGTQANTYTLGTTANDLANWNGLTVKGGTVELAVDQSFTGNGSSDSVLCMIDGTLTLGNDTTARSLTVEGDVELLGGTLSGGTQGGAGGAKGTLESTGGDFVNNGSTFTNAPNLTSTTSGSHSLTGSQGYTGIGTLTMAGTGSFTLDQTIAAQRIDVQSGTLLLGANDRIGNSTNMTLSGGTLATNGFSDQLGTLTLTEDSIIDFGGGDSVLTFADSSTQAWDPNATLTIINWGGIAIEGGGVDQLFFGSNDSGLTSAQLGQIVFADYPGFATGHLPDGEVVPVPEPGAIAAAFGLTALIGWRERKRLKTIWASLAAHFRARAPAQ
jgi:fibronectin-binding autotransporter adhesin